jgi:WD40 repeat protein
VEVIDESENPLNEDDCVEALEDDLEYDEEDQDGPEMEDGASLTFENHGQPVFCCDVTRDGKLAVSGGQDDTAFVWQTEDGQVKFECEGHSDSVVCVAFNSNDKLVASGDMGGTLKVWSVASGRCVYQQELTELTWIRWHPVAADVLLAGSSDGHCCLYKIDANNKIKWMTGASAATSGEFLPDGKRAAVVYADSSIRVWDLASGQAIATVQEYRKPAELCSLAVRDDGLLACGSVDGKVRLVNSVTGKVTWQFFVDNINRPIIPPSAQADEEPLNNSSVEALCFAEALSVLITGSVNGLIEFWDVNAQIKRLQIKSPGGLSKLTVCKGQPWHVFASGLDGVVRVYDIRDGKLLQELIGHRLEVLDVSLSEQTDVMVSASEDGTVKVFRIAV